MSPGTLSKLDTTARLLIVLGILLILTGESIGILPIVVGVPWIVAGLMGWGRPKIDPYRGPTPKAGPTPSETDSSDPPQRSSNR